MTKHRQDNYKVITHAERALQMGLSRNVAAAFYCGGCIRLSNCVLREEGGEGSDHNRPRPIWLTFYYFGLTTSVHSYIAANAVSALPVAVSISNEMGNWFVYKYNCVR